jgi:hypothetical protein
MGGYIRQQIKTPQEYRTSPFKVSICTITIFEAFQALSGIE